MTVLPRPWRLAPLLLLLATLAACGGPARPDLSPGARYPGLSCAPFARALTGVALRGDAADWWGEAAGRYRRSTVPREGALLVLARTARLPSGHVAVVSRVFGPRAIAVVQANWVRDRLGEDQPVQDVSDANDWSAVRVWWPPSGQLGVHVYPALGFILPDRPLPHAALLSGAAPAAARAAGG